MRPAQTTVLPSSWYSRGLARQTQYGRPKAQQGLRQQNSKRRRARCVFNQLFRWLNAVRFPEHQTARPCEAQNADQAGR